MNEEKFIKKYMRAAKQFGEDQNPCYSRKIGCFIVDPVDNRVLATGYNGPPQDTPHCTDPEYLSHVVWPLLTNDEKRCSGTDNKDLFVELYANCKTCPRRIAGVASGKRLELCSCVHAESNTIVNAQESLRSSWCFIWGGCPCWDCAKLIIRARIARVFCTSDGFAFTDQAKWLLEKAKVQVRIFEPAALLKD